MRTVRWSAGVAAVALAIIGAYLFTLDHDALVRLVGRVSGYGKLDKISGQLTGVRSLLVRSAPILMAGMFAFCAWKPRIILVPISRVAEAFRYGRAVALDVWRIMPLWERWTFRLLLLGSLMVHGWYAITAPAHVDEAMTWLLFSSRGPLVAWTFYAAPNNHLLHSLFTTVTNWLPVEPLLAIRVPTVLIALCAQAVLHLMLRRLTNAFATLIAISLAIGSYPLLYYGYVSRGYMLVFFSFVLAYGATILVMRTGDRRAMLLLTLSCAMGMFTMPSFLYAAGLLFAFAFLHVPTGNSRVYRGSLFASGVLLIILTAAFYLPAIAMSGLAAFTSNKWVKPTGRMDVLAHWWPHFSSTFNWITGTAYGFLVVAVVVIGAWLTAPSRRGIVLLNVFLLTGSLLIPFAHGVIPFERTWIHLIVPITVCAALLIRPIGAWKRSKPWMGIAIAIALLFGLIVRFERVLPEQEYMAFSARTMFQAVRTVEPQDIYCEFVVMGDHLFFDLQSRGIPATIVHSPEGIERASHLSEPVYSLLIVREAAPVNDPNYRELYADDIQRVYVRRDLHPGE